MGETALGEENEAKSVNGGGGGAYLPDCSLAAALLLHVVPVAALVAGLWLLPMLLGLNLVHHTLPTLQIALAVEAPLVFLTVTFASTSQRSSSWAAKALWRGFVSLVTGAFLAAFGAIIFGAPLALESSLKTAFWAQLLTVLVVLPAGIVLGGSWSHWQRLFAFTKPRGRLEYSICVPAHGAVIGAWFGAWPMPLDWERPWQEWPVCVTYGMAGGFILGSILSFSLILLNDRGTRRKQD